LLQSCLIVVSRSDKDNAARCWFIERRFSFCVDGSDIRRGGQKLIRLPTPEVKTIPTNLAPLSRHIEPLLVDGLQ
jgi:hypothetical protein